MANATPTGVQDGAGTLNGGCHGPMPYVSETQDWGPAPAAPGRDVLDITATNIAATTIDVARAHIGCAAHLNVKSDGPIDITLSGCGRLAFATRPRRYPGDRADRRWCRCNTFVPAPRTVASAGDDAGSSRLEAFKWMHP